jgi:hypothetical protein
MEKMSARWWCSWRSPDNSRSVRITSKQPGFSRVPGGGEGLQLFQQFSRDGETVKTVLDRSAHSNTLPKQGVNEKTRLAR